VLTNVYFSQLFEKDVFPYTYGEMGRWGDALRYDPNITHPFPMMAATANGPVVRDTIVTKIQVISYNLTLLI
jgi:hypothetical protein